MGKALKKAMFLGKLYRKKRALLLPQLPDPKKKPPSDMSWRCPLENAYKREQHFLRGCQLLHTSFCGCDDFINHVIRLQNLHGNLHQPTGPSTPPVGRRALALPAAPEPWRGDGGGPEGDRTGDGPADAGGDYAPGDLDDLFAAAAADQE